MKFSTLNGYPIEIDIINDIIKITIDHRDNTYTSFMIKLTEKKVENLIAELAKSLEDL